MLSLAPLCLEGNSYSCDLISKLFLILRSILLHGPPGTGKTYFAKIIATITQSAFLYASAAQFDEILVGRYVASMRRYNS